MTVLIIIVASVVSLSLLSPRTSPQAPIISEPFIPRSPIYSAAQDVGGVANVISISGSGVSKMDPDTAVVSIQIMVESPTADRATRDAANIFDNLIKSLTKEGITEDQIISASFSLNPVFFYPRDQEPQISGYMLRHSISVTVASSELDDLGLRAAEVVDIATKAGVNTVSSIQFTVSEDSMRMLRNDALRNAIIDAREKAEVIADALEVELIGVSSVSENVYTPGPVFFESARADVAMGAPPTRVLPGEFEISANVFVQYTIGV